MLSQGFRKRFLLLLPENTPIFLAIHSNVVTLQIFSANSVITEFSALTFHEVAKVVL